MCNFLDAAPTGKHAMAVGDSVKIGVKEVLNVDIGTGRITEMNDTAFAADGDYDFDILGFKGQGQWTLSLSNTGGDDWQVAVKFTGKFRGDVTGSATCAQSGTGESTEIAYTGVLGGHRRTITQSFQNDGFIDKAKLKFAPVPAGGHEFAVYFYNADYDD